MVLLLSCLLIFQELAVSILIGLVAASYHKNLSVVPGSCHQIEKSADGWESTNLALQKSLNNQGNIKVCNLDLKDNEGVYGAYSDQNFGQVSIIYLGIS